VRTQWATTWISDDTSAGGYQSGFKLNGRGIIQEAQFLRAAKVALFDRGNESYTFNFDVWRVFDTPGLAEQFLLGHRKSLPTGNQTLTFRCGGIGETPVDVLAQNAVRGPIVVQKYRGASVLLSYEFRAPDISAVITPPEDDEMTASTPIPNGVDTFSVTGLALPAIPARVLPHVRITSGGLVLHANVVNGTITTDGFTVQLSGVTDSADYILDYSYVF